jgi:ATP-dependent RNA helicase DeaD
MNQTVPDFAALNLPDPLLRALQDIGYETPSPIQQQSIPWILQGEDLVGQAQTGTGKTAAFALPLLARIDGQSRYPQVLVLAPTRELALQVAESFSRYASHLPDIQVATIYGGQSYKLQIQALRRGAQIIVGTPGRIMDHMDKGTLQLDRLQALVLDEADEMLRMGFVDDIEWIMEKLPAERQTVLFSATFPEKIQRISQRYLKNPKEIRLSVASTTSSNVRQRYWLVQGMGKFSALVRVLESEDSDGVLIFVRTKTQTIEMAEQLQRIGFKAEALNGDLPQARREKMVEQLRSGQVNIIIATDVAARGLDVERITHVINYDIPQDSESYTHRIGRTGRAGRNGEAILLVSPREKGLLRIIETNTRQKIERLTLPTIDNVNQKRIARFKSKIQQTVAESQDLSIFRQLVSEYLDEHPITPLDLAAALAKMAQGEQSLLLQEAELPSSFSEETPSRGKRSFSERERSSERPAVQRGGEERRSRRSPESRPEHSRIGERRSPFSGESERRAGESERPSFFANEGEGRRTPRRSSAPSPGMARFRIEVGHNDGIKPGNIVGAIANEAALSSQEIGPIHIYADHSTVDLPAGLPSTTLRILKNVWVSGKQMNIQKVS